jgi:hypothetical protein
MSHYLLTSDRKQVNSINLVTKDRKPGLKNINPGINPHFLSTRSTVCDPLVDTGPARARIALRFLERLLNGSMCTVRQKTRTLLREMELVRDYQSLQKIHF